MNRGLPKCKSCNNLLTTKNYNIHKGKSACFKCGERFDLNIVCDPEFFDSEVNPRIKTIKPTLLPLEIQISPLESKLTNIIYAVLFTIVSIYIITISIDKSSMFIGSLIAFIFFVPALFSINNLIKKTKLMVDKHYITYIDSFYGMKIKRRRSTNNFAGIVLGKKKRIKRKNKPVITYNYHLSMIFNGEKSLNFGLNKEIAPLNKIRLQLFVDIMSHLGKHQQSLNSV